MTASFLRPRPGFEWSAVNWGGPDEPRTEHCSYCGDAFPDRNESGFIPLILLRRDGWVAEFCDHCQATWWGMQSFDEVEPRRGKRAPGPRGRGCGRRLGLGRAIGRASGVARVGAPVGLRRGFADRRGK